jgi:chromosome segregation ATPase
LTTVCAIHETTIIALHEAWEREEAQYKAKLAEAEKDYAVLHEEFTAKNHAIKHLLSERDALSAKLAEVEKAVERLCVIATRFSIWRVEDPTYPPDDLERAIREADEILARRKGEDRG